jgi:VacB/RNase II family 3'-5' exoribonuclease
MYGYKAVLQHNLVGRDQLDMTNRSNEKGKVILEQIARRAMTESGFLPDFSTAALAELEKIQSVASMAGPGAKDLRLLPWCSIDNDDSLDLDQLTAAEGLADKLVRILVAIADCDSLVKIDSAIDMHARQNTTSIYTAARTFPMLPEKLSTDMTSLNYHEDRASIVVDMVINDGGEIQSSSIYAAVVRNQARLTYNSVGAWLENQVSQPEKAVAEVAGLAENIRLQDRIAQKLRAERYKRGALELQTLEAHPVFEGDEIKDLKLDETNRAKELIEDLMIAANDTTALFLKNKNVPSLRRVVRSPKRWDRIVEIAAQYKVQLPAEADAKALANFLLRQRTADPLRFPDLSLSIIKLLGSGEYAVESNGKTPAGHFGLAVKDYTHSTAPNRRFPDLITQRILKAVLNGSTLPYNQDQLIELAKRCTTMEDEATKIERMVAKSAAAMLLSSRIGAQFDALCTGAADKGTWVRIFNPHIEGRLLKGYQGIDVGDRLKVRLIHTDIEKGFIDFEKVI